MSDKTNPTTLRSNRRRDYPSTRSGHRRVRSTGSGISLGNFGDSLDPLPHSNSSRQPLVSFATEISVNETLNRDDDEVMCNKNAASDAPFAFDWTLQKLKSDCTAIVTHIFSKKYRSTLVRTVKTWKTRVLCGPCCKSLLAAVKTQKDILHVREGVGLTQTEKEFWKFLQIATEPLTDITAAQEKTINGEDPAAQDLISTLVALTRVVSQDGSTEVAQEFAEFLLRCLFIPSLCVLKYSVLINEVLACAVVPDKVDKKDARRILTRHFLGNNHTIDTFIETFFMKEEFRQELSSKKNAIKNGETRKIIDDLIDKVEDIYVEAKPPTRKELIRVMINSGPPPCTPLVLQDEVHSQERGTSEITDVGNAGESSNAAGDVANDSNQAFVEFVNITKVFCNGIASQREWASNNQNKYPGVDTLGVWQGHLSKEAGLGDRLSSNELDICLEKCGFSKDDRSRAASMFKSYVQERSLALMESFQLIDTPMPFSAQPTASEDAVSESRSEVPLDPSWILLSNNGELVVPVLSFTLAGLCYNEFIRTAVISEREKITKGTESNFGEFDDTLAVIQADVDGSDPEDWTVAYLASAGKLWTFDNNTWVLHDIIVHDPAYFTCVVVLRCHPSYRLNLEIRTSEVAQLINAFAFGFELQSEACVHPNILMPLGYTLKQVNDSNVAVGVFTELCDGPCLNDTYLTVSRLKEPDRIVEVTRLMSQILSAVKKCEELGIVHRAINPFNILYDAEGNLKLTGFGNAHAPGEDDNEETSTIDGPVGFLPPEVLDNPGDSSKQDKIDIWCCGVVMYLLMHGKMPTRTEYGWFMTTFEASKIFNKTVKSGSEKLQDCAKKMVALCEDMLQLDYYGRATAEEALLKMQELQGKMNNIPFPLR